MEHILGHKNSHVAAPFLLHVSVGRLCKRQATLRCRLPGASTFFLRMRSVAGAFLCLCILFLALPDTAWALQAHGPPEGIYIHQMAHIFFLGSLLYLYRDLKHSSEQEQGWRYLRWFCLLMLCWNVVAFIGHAVTFHLAEEHISDAGSFLHSRLLGPMNLSKTLFYITRFDHLLVVPALYFLYLGLRTLYAQVDEKAGTLENRENTA